MLNAYATMLAATGLTQNEAARLHGVRHDTVRSWAAGRRTANDGALRDLATLVAQQNKAVEQGLATVAAQPVGSLPDVIELGVASDDAEAESLGWPTASAHRVAIGRLAATLRAQGHAVEVHPRGSTLGSAGASDAHHG